MVKVKVSEDWIKERREALPAELKALITLQPGRTKTHYLYLKVKSGGVRGLSDDKYAALDTLMRSGEIVAGYNSGKRKDYQGLYPAGHPDIDKPAVDFELEAALIRLVRKHAGRGRAFYCRLSPADGGLLGSQERKEKALDRLITTGQVKRVMLERAVGRKNHELHAV